MFSEAVRIASGFTYPYVGLRRRADGQVFTILAAFIVVNPEGWIVTSAHLIEELLAAGKAVEGSESEAGASPDSRIVLSSEMWAIPDFATTRPRLVAGRVNKAADIATGRLEPFDQRAVAAFPVFRDTAQSPLEQGASVCRLGFPFHTVHAEYDAAHNGFQVAPNAFPIPRFALDGIVARFNRRRTADGSSALFVETSTPGLRGQSGGPLLDTQGRVCGVQSQTAHVDLGFDASYENAAQEKITERQFLNVGLASHVDEVRALLDLDGVEYATG